MTRRGTDDGELSVGGVATAGRVVGWAAKGLEALVAVALVAMMSLTCIDVVGRYAFGKPIYGSAEMTQFLLGFLVFAALGLVSHRDAHIAIDVPGRWIARRIPRTHRLLAGLPSVAGLGLVTYELQRQAGQASGSARRTVRLGPSAPRAHHPHRRPGGRHVRRAAPRHRHRRLRRGGVRGTVRPPVPVRAVGRRREGADDPGGMT